MAALTRNVALSFGLAAASVAVHNALEKETSGNKLCCTGIAGKDEHAPTPISQVNRCTTCDDVVPYDQIVKGRAVDGGFVLITTDEVAEARVDSEALKKRAGLTAHPTEQVDLSTVPGEKLYYLTPEAGAEETYATFVHMVEAHPELTFMALWTPRSRAGQFALKARDGVLVWQERVRAENIKPVPLVEAEAPAAMIGMMDQVLGLEGMVSDYEPATYEDTFEAKIRDIVATKAPVAAGEVVAATGAITTPSTAVSGMSALAQMLADAEKSKRPARKKAAPRKKVAKTA